MSGQPPLRIRPVALADAEAIAAIYAHHVQHGTATFDTQAPTAEQWREKIAYLSERGWPFIVAEDEDGAVIGYAYAAQFRDRPAYAHACEDSVYLHPEKTGRGIGMALLAALIPAAGAAGFTQMLGVIAGGEDASVALHAGQGFRHAGRMEKVGYKFGRWLDTIYMQRALPSGDQTA
ncbi:MULTISPECIES: GNAT family N-acetyltransferase [unclassified Sphingobium]|uniref:GNAT family N-acetyltransferase n=1 Tax=unclassified Sphingobium TaxID=2611147 RepID=UPI00222542B2|nr:MULTISPECIES: GNAT family N-acetyltransferase [unclassified Sphingobium]MCW2395126.1 phosphinothricin acetyltransferase [Sphingobium sp. B8D3B]MCW2418640.1 phosphinothricin acetyltransferase [Sphingobium sp. B8D3C]